MSDRTARARRSEYAVLSVQATRWRDNDAYGHMNNAVFYEYVDTAVNAWLARAGALEVPDGPVIGLVVSSSCAFHAPLAFPRDVTAGLRLGRMGRSSVRYEVGLFDEGEDRAAAEAEFTHVYVDRASRRPVDLPESLRAALERIRPAG